MERIIDLVVDDEKEKAVKYAKRLAKELKKKIPGLRSSFLSAELVVVVGGDGMMLKAANAYDFRPIFLGINFGHKGFLMNDSGDISMVADRIFHRKFKVHRFPLLEIEAEDGWKGLAMNDVYFNRITGQTCKVSVSVDGVKIAERISGDGIVICTALGSCGYFLPAGGSALHANLSVIGFAPVVRNVPIQIVPMVFPSTSQLEVTLLSPPEEVRGWYDGIELPYFQKIKVRKADHQIKLAFWEDENFTERLVRKIMIV